MKKIKTNFKDLVVYQGKKFSDKRGFLREIFHGFILKKKLVFSITSKSSIGFTLPWTCVISDESKQRNTWAITETVRIWDKNWFPKPSPKEAPLTKPAISTNSIRAGKILEEPDKEDKTSNLPSGIDTIPTFGSIVQKG